MAAERLARTEQQKAAVVSIMDALMALPWQDRAEVWKAVEYNDIFCVHCGYGDTDHPNASCQCQNDD